MELLIQLNCNIKFEINRWSLVRMTGLVTWLSKFEWHFLSVNLHILSMKGDQSWRCEEAISQVSDLGQGQCSSIGLIKLVLRKPPLSHVMATVETFMLTLLHSLVLLCVYTIVLCTKSVICIEYIITSKELSLNHFQ